MVKAIDMAGLVLGLVYLWLEFKASIWLWLVSVIMPIVHGYLYWERGLYADFGMEVYYVLAAVYGYAMWRWARNRDGGVGEAGAAGSACWSSPMGTDLLDSDYIHR